MGQPRREPVTPSEAPAATWSGLVMALGARAYLVLVGVLAACALAPMLAGLTGSVVQSGSMEPHVSAGDVVLSRAVAADDVLPMGRVITFTAPAGSARPGLVMHRLVDEESDGSLVTAGDANVDVDSTPLAREDIIGRGTLLVPWIGLPALWLGTGRLQPFAIWVLVTVLALAVEARSLLQQTGRHRRPDGTAALRGARPALRAAGPVVAVTALLLVVAVAAGAGTAPADAAFTARTSSIGSSWSAKPASPATGLVFTTHPSSSTGGRAFASQPTVRVTTAAGTTITGTRTVTLALTSAGGAVLTCAANPLTSTTGVFAFTGCAIDKVGSYTLTATSGSLTAATSARVTVTAGPAVALRFAATPSTTVAKATFATQPAVTVVDAGGNRTTSSVAVTLRLSTPGGLTCTANPRAAVSGLATFTGCAVATAGSYTLIATSGALTAATSPAFVVTPAPRPQLTCQSSTWYATFGWSPTPYTATTYRLYVNGVQVPAQGADGYNSYVQLSPANVPAATFAPGSATVEVRKVLTTGQEEVVGYGTVVLGPASYRTYLCG
jgi:signal peptidase I